MKLLLASLLQENALVNDTQQVTDEMILSIPTDNMIFRQCYDYTHKAVYGFAYSILKNPQDAQDVVQDVYIKMYQNASKYKPQGKPMAWILTITRNLCLMKIRDNKKTVKVEEQEGLENLFQVPAETIHEHTYILQRALSSLTEESRQIVILHALTGLKHREIAEVLNLNVSTVLSKYNRAIKKLRELIEEDEEYEQ